MCEIKDTMATGSHFLLHWSAYLNSQLLADERPQILHARLAKLIRLEGQKENVMVDQGPKANTYCTVKVHNGTRIVLTHKEQSAYLKCI